MAHQRLHNSFDGFPFVFIVPDFNRSVNTASNYIPSIEDFHDDQAANFSL